MKIDECISREMAIKKLQMQLLNLEADQDKGEYSELCENRGARDALDEAISDIREIKAADVQPVIHAHWEWTNSCSFKRSNCGKVGRSFNDNFCANCGAKMDGKDGEQE